MEQLANIDFSQLYRDYELGALIFFMVIMLYPVLLISKRLITPIIRKSVERKGTSYSKILEKNNLYFRLVQVVIALYLILWSDVFDKANLAPGIFGIVKNTIVHIYVIITLAMLASTLIDIGVDIYNKKAVSKKLPISLHAQIVKIIVIGCAILAAISTILGLSIPALFASLGAAAALFTFVFKDTVISLIASLQVTFQDIIRVGDWVSLPKYSVDGDVEKITIAVVIIRNFDGSTTTVPTSIFLNDAVKNWRPMFEKGGRRIKRAVSLDMDTVKICNQKTLDAIKKLAYMQDFAKDNHELFIAKNEITNITMFRHYVNCYLKSHQGIHKEGFTFLVRQLDPTPTGIPLELYVFTKDTKWVNYENIQAAIFEHLLGILPKFGLRAFQMVIGQGNTL